MGLAPGKVSTFASANIKRGYSSPSIVIGIALAASKAPRNASRCSGVRERESTVRLLLLIVRLGASGFRSPNVFGANRSEYHCRVFVARRAA